MKTERPVFDFELCMACGICVQACLFGCLATRKNAVEGNKKPYPELIFGQDCTGCGICQTNCPIGCISMKDLNALAV